MGEHVLLIGASVLDIKGKPSAGLEPGTSNPGEVTLALGGTARNVAENLARLGAPVTLISAVADDDLGPRLLAPTAAAGVNIAHILTVPGARTSAYIAILEEDGTLAVALNDVSIMEHITEAHLYQNRQLFQEASMVMVDGSLTPAALEMVVRLAGQYKVPLCADPASTRLADKLRPYLSSLHLIVPNEQEAAALCAVEFEGYNPDASLELARQLIASGVNTAVVTLSDYGLVYADEDEAGYIPARYSQIVDAIGAGDSVIAAIMFGLLQEMPTIEAIRLGVAAAGLTLQSQATVVPDLSLDMLYDHLLV
jgi:pseudouridine kinase